MNVVAIGDRRRLSATVGDNRRQSAIVGDSRRQSAIVGDIRRQSAIVVKLTNIFSKKKCTSRLPQVGYHGRNYGGLTQPHLQAHSSFSVLHVEKIRGLGMRLSLTNQITLFVITTYKQYTVDQNKLKESHKLLQTSPCLVQQSNHYSNYCCTIIVTKFCILHV